MAPLQLTDSITSVPLVGPSYGKKLERLDIHTIADALHHYPVKYLDRSQVTPIADVIAEEKLTVSGELTHFKNIVTRNRKQIQQATVQDETGFIDITWFNQPFLAQSLKVGEQYAFSGKVKTYRNKLSLQSPDFERLDPNRKVSIHTGRLIAVYPETAGVSSKWLRSRIDHILHQTEITDPLPESIRLDYQLLPLSDALLTIHQPESEANLKAARKRLAFDELLILQLYGSLKRQHSKIKRVKQILRWDSTTIKDFIGLLPFKLTRCQTKAIDEILSDLKGKQPMNRLLEGDVGSGKTVVAAAAMMAVKQAGFQSVLMAPTEILAQQHYQSLGQFFKDTDVSLGLYTASNKAQETADVLIGTHALLYKVERFNSVALIVIDEQHRFGVEQRAQLEQLGNQPHRLTMSATPIPRTVALTLYGDLGVSILDELPKARKPVKTWLVPEPKRLKGYEWIKQQLALGDQLFVVCPLIEKSSALMLEGVRSATEEHRYLQGIFSEYTVDLLHGRMKAAQKDAIINRFKNNQSQILVSTQVIEVGIDIPNATMMVIEAAERFGLAQLHQLRGRVGRGSKPGYCLLFTTNNEETKRLRSLTEVHSGFELAKIDLKLRGPGQVFGLAQHGYDTLKLARLTDSKLLKMTRDTAEAIVRSDPHLIQHPQFKTLLQPYLDQTWTAN